MPAHAKQNDKSMPMISVRSERSTYLCLSGRTCTVYHTDLNRESWQSSTRFPVLCRVSLLSRRLYQTRACRTFVFISICAVCDSGGMEFTITLCDLAPYLRWSKVAFPLEIFLFDCCISLMASKSLHRRHVSCFVHRQHPKFKIIVPLFVRLRLLVPF